MRTIFPPFMSRKIGLTDPTDKNAEQVTAAMLRSRRHKSPEHQAENVIAIAYELNQDERSAIAAGAPLIVSQVTYGQPPNEQLLHVGADVAAEYYGVTEATSEELAAHRDQVEAELDQIITRWRAARQKRAEILARILDGENITMEHADAELAKQTKRVADQLKLLGEANQAAGF